METLSDRTGELLKVPGMLAIMELKVLVFVTYAYVAKGLTGKICYFGFATFF